MLFSSAIGLGARSFRGPRSTGTAAPFTPDALADRLVWWYEAASPGTLGQTSSGPSAVAALDPIGYIADKSPKAAHLTQATSAKRIKLNVDGDGHPYFYFDGTKSLYLDSGAVNLSAHTKITVFWSGFVDATDAVLKFPFYFKPAGGAGSFAVYVNGDVASARLEGPSGQSDTDAAGIISTAPKLYHAEFDLASDRKFKRSRVGHDGFDVPVGTNVSPGLPVTTSTHTTAPLRLGDWVGGQAWEGGIYAMLAVAGDISDEDLDNIAAYFATVSPSAIKPSKNRLHFSHANDWKAEASNSTALTPNAYAYSTLYYDTSATSVDIAYYNNGIIADYVDLGVYVDGVYFDHITPSGTGAGTATIALPAGAKRVGIVTSPMSLAGADDGGGNYPLGTQVRSVTFNASARPYIYPSTGRVLVYGDSVSTGGHAYPVLRDAWVMKLRGMTSTDISLYGESSRSFRTDSVNTTAAARSRLVDIVRGYNPSTFYMAIGVNDYFKSFWSAASFGTAYAAMLDALHTALPGMAVYCQSPLNPSVGAAANTQGSNLAAYSAAIEAACSTRAWTTFVDGADIITDAATQLVVDGVHPNAVGNLAYANFVKAELGL